MDTRFYVSREEFHNVQMDVRQLQAVQSSQSERLQRLEKRNHDDAAMRSAWSNSPFPSALVGTPQHGPVRLPSTENFDLDEQSQTLGSLHLEPDDEPIRRAAAASRANSVRFDESANLAQSARSFNDIGPFRPGSSLMMERTYSHKSDGRHSSAGHSVHSVHSVASGRGSSIGLDTNFMTGGDNQDSPIDMPEPPPVFYVLGSVPAIVRCWLTKDFANNTLLYAAVCTGAQKSTIDFSLIKELGLDDLVYREVDSTFKIHLQTYLAEAIPATKSADPVPQIPFLAVNFEVYGMVPSDEAGPEPGKKSIRIFIGSDALRAHSADVLFSRNVLSLYSSEREKLTVPFVRPEDDGVFRNLCTASVTPDQPKLNAAAAEFVSSDLKSRDSISGDDDEHQQTHLELFDDELDSNSLHGSDSRHFHRQQLSTENGEGSDPSRGSHGQPNGTAASVGASILSPGAVSPTTVHPVPAARWRGAVSGAASDNGDGEKLPRASAGSDYSGKEASATFESSRRDPSAIWGSWRHGDSTAGSDGGHRESGPLSGYQPAGRPRTMKVLKSKTGNSTASTRTVSSYEPILNSRSSGEHRRKSQGLSGTAANGSLAGIGNTHHTTASVGGGGNPAPSNVIRWESKRSISSSNAAAHQSGLGKENKSQQGLAALEPRGNPSTTPRTSNPVGGASAFAWMKSSKSKTSPSSSD
ncbi:ubiquitin carboxyl-terminal hydrolase 19 [Ophiostoma piceae UAMH 11346]|uniref:Ubiquitin carboxyl-terminal hydrolase 19 n=1 Tax=Ophiostoma piceae (strain UAMH 11346) TaxID=1262450 RepID=S3C174_OPHP1|nr:ubiquitin carboxyl-terminal hydrolase 19 [Ophiostoma piceae UAMH 11346]